MRATCAEIPGVAPSWRRGSRGFTLIELIFVLILIGVISSMVIPNLSGLTPKYRMRTYARTIARTIHEMRVAAIATGKLTGIRYVLAGEDSYVQPIPTAPIDYPDMALSERESSVKHELPAGVFIRGINLPGSRGGAISNGTIDIGFSPNGTTGSHVVVLELESTTGPPSILAVKFNSISGVIDYYNHEVEFQHHEN